MIEPARPADDSLAILLRAAFFLMVVVGLVFYGAVHPLPFAVTTALLGAIAIASPLMPIDNPAIARYCRLGLYLVVLSALYVALQSLWFPGNPLANPLWNAAGRLIGIDGGAISVAPRTSLEAIPNLVTPVLVFIVALLVHQDDAAALRLWRNLALLGGGLAVYGIIQLRVFPERILFESRDHTDALRSVLVNRNTTAAVFALAGLALLAVVVVRWRDLSARLFFQRIASFRVVEHGKYFVFLLYCLLLFVTLLAMLLTKSRAGALFGGLAVVTMAYFWLASLLRRQQAMTRKIGLVLALVLAALVFAGLFAGRTLHRAEIHGDDEGRWCAYSSTLAGIADNPVFGTGFGSFREIYPMYRATDCGIDGIWERAHSSYLEGYFGLGLPFLPFVGLVAYHLVAALRQGFRERRRYRVIPIASLAMLFYIALHSAVDFPLQIPGIANYFAAFLGAGVSISLARRGRRAG